MKSHVVPVLCLFSLLPLARAQSPSAPDPQATITTNSTLVLVPALVRDKRGNLVFTLTANDFALTDDGIAQKLTLEPDTGGEPLALVVDIEIGGAGTREYEKFRALAPMIESIVGNVPHKIAVVAFDSRYSLEQDFTSSTDDAAQAILDLEPGCSRQNHLDDCAAPHPEHNISLGDNGAAILDSIGYSVDLLRKQPTQYRRAILLLSETLDRGSTLKLDDALRAITDTNTTIYSIGFSTGKSEAAHYGHRELPTTPVGPGGSWLRVENAHPNPPHGCMGKDPDPDPDATHNKLIQAYDCLTQLAPPLALAKMAAIDATDSLRRNIPETVARLTGGEYFKMTDAKSLERSLETITNHLPNRYILSFQPQSPHPGFHVLSLKAPEYEGFEITARSSYWATPQAAKP
jgi:VWFA-related protein